MWKFVTAGSGSETELFGIKIFEYEWNYTREKVEVQEPYRLQKYMFDVYTINVDDKIYRFVAGEMTASVFGFWVEEKYL